MNLDVGVGDFELVDYGDCRIYVATSATSGEDHMERCFDAKGKIFSCKVDTGKKVKKIESVTVTVTSTATVLIEWKSKYLFVMV